MKYLFFVTFLTLSVHSFAEEAAEGKKDRIGPGKAVIESSEKEGLRLSQRAVKNLELEYMTATSSTLKVPISSLIQFQDFSAVYRERAGWFKMVEIEPTLLGESVQFTSKDILKGDRIVTKNAGFLRVIDLDVFGPEADACAD